MDYLVVKICVICAVSCWVWVNLLTKSRQLLDWAPNYYPDKLRPKPLECSHCLSGWIALITSAIQFPYWFYDNSIDFYNYDNAQIYFYILFSPFLAMVFNRIISR